jgi:hypothetical protein
LDKDRKITLAILLAGLVVVFLVSCGDDGGTDLSCNNCDFWTRVFGRAARFPSASPVDPHLLAYSSKLAFSGDSLVTSPEFHIWVVRRDDESDTTWSYQITSEAYNDFNPAWSPDGQKIAFERNIGAGDEWQIFVVDVSDLESPGLPEAITETDSTAIPYSNRWPSWVMLGEETWICFCNTPLGSGNSDILIIRYPDLGSPDTVSIDPADFAVREGGVMSYTFDDEFSSSNGTNLIAFSSPNREPVVDIEVIARSEEQPDNSAVAEIFVNQKDSGRTTPYTFKYRPVPEDVEIEGSLDYYCEDHMGTIVSASDSLYTYLIDFVHTHGTIGVRSNPGNRWIYFDNDTEPQEQRTSDDTEQYRFFTCKEPETYHIWTEQFYHSDSCYLDASTIVVPEYYYVDSCRTKVDSISAAGETTFTYLNCVAVAPGETTFVSFQCGTGAAYGSSSRSVFDNGCGGPPSSRLTALGSGAGPRAMQQNARGVWLLDLGEEPETDDDEMYLIDVADVGLYYPTLSGDGKYVAYVRGDGASWDVVVRDVSSIASGAVGRRVVIGLPGSTEDIECWRAVEKISWLPTGAGRKIAASISVCRSGTPEQYEVWIADLSGFLD